MILLASSQTVKMTSVGGLMADYIHINRPGPSKSEPIGKRNRTKWCFSCRKHLPHMLTMTYEIEPSYYEPLIWWKCSVCGKDRTQFWGSF